MIDIFLSAMIGVNIVISIAILSLLISGPTRHWSFLSKFGFFIMGVGILFQVVFNFNTLLYGESILPYARSLKDIGIAIFVVSLVFRWIDGIVRPDRRKRVTPVVYPTLPVVSVAPIVTPEVSSKD